MAWLNEIANEIGNCTLCDLHASRTHAVPGEGPAPAPIMFIGEAPGKREDELGRPFVGRAGNILNGLLRDSGISREQSFITSVVKCRPPDNRDPKKKEIMACKTFLLRQIKVVRPRVIVPMGRFATSVIMDFFDIPFTDLGSVRRKECIASVNGEAFFIIPVYHPAVITHNPNKRRDLIEDFLFLGEKVRDKGEYS